MDQFGKKETGGIADTTISAFKCEIEHETNAVSQGFAFQFGDGVNKINTYQQQVSIHIPNNTKQQT